MPATTSVGTKGTGNFVEYSTLKLYLTKQYKGMGGAKIASHKFFGRAFGALGNRGASGNGAVPVLLIPTKSVAPYLKAQYRGMGGADIAGHSHFLRSCPTVSVGPAPSNLA